MIPDLSMAGHDPAIQGYEWKAQLLWPLDARFEGGHDVSGGYQALASEH